MAAEDWYRNTRWTKQTQRSFWDRWDRCRTDSNRAQYLRIQGGYLAESDSEVTIRAGIKLLQQVVREFPNVQIQQAIAHVQIGNAFVTLGDDAEAVAAYRAAHEAEQRTPNIDAGARFCFALLATARADASLYDEAYCYLGASPTTESSLLISYCFIDRAARAIILADQGDRHESRRLASQAIELAHRKHSGLSRHPDVGLVSLDKTLEGALYARLTALVASTHPSQRNG